MKINSRKLSNDYQQGGQGGKRDILELSNDLSIRTALVYKDRQAGWGLFSRHDSSR